MGDLPQSPRPGEPPPSRTGSKPLFLSTDSCYRTTTIPGSKARASGVLPGGEDVESRSEEHTSELQSRLHLVCRLLLEKKKKYNSQVRGYRVLESMAKN